MSITIKLQYNASEQNKLTKSVSDVATLTGTLKEQTSIIDPVILIEYVGTLPPCNYMTIECFNRSYFITGIESVRTGLWRISAHVDVLSSYADQIRQNTAVIRRQENKWNLYLDDGSFRCYQNPNIVMKAFPSGFSTHEFVLAVAGG